MNRLIVIMGVSGCGKTTVGSLLAQAIEADYLEGDSFHSPENKAKMGAGIALSDEDRWPWFDSLISAAQSVLNQKRSAVLVCSALKSVYRDYLLGQFPDQWRLIFLEGDFDLIESRMNARHHEYMTPDLLQSQFDILEAPREHPNILRLSIDKKPEILVSDIRKWLSEH